MKSLCVIQCVILLLCGLLTVSPAVPLNATVSRQTGLCDYVRQQSPHVIGGFVPQCDVYGNFLPQQCSGSTGYCWCVDVITGVEIPNTRTKPGAVPVNCDMEFYCPYGWSRFGRRCLVFIDSPKTWVEAERYCLFEGSNLASIHSYEESHYIQSLTRGNTHSFPETWIGGHDAIHKDFWMWCDGSKFEYDEWHSEYSAVGWERAERCLKMNFGYTLKWSNGVCTDVLPFVCAK